MAQVVLLDGGLGQEVYRRSGKPAHPLWSLQVMRERPSIVQSVHEDFVRSGARVLTLNTYTATPMRLERDGELAWFESLQKDAYRIADSARRNCGDPFGPVLLAGCLPPLVGSYSPECAPSSRVCEEQYRAIVEVQPNVDLFICETMPSIREGLVAAETALVTGKPVLLSFTLDDEQPNRLRSGESVDDMLKAVRGYPLSGLLFNCSRPETIRSALPRIQSSGFRTGAYANGFESVSDLRPGGTVDVLEARRDLEPSGYADLALQWIATGSTIVGGCCEVGPAHIETLRQALVANRHTIAGL